VGGLELHHTGLLVLTDFGLAKIVNADTNTNSMVGTKEYMVSAFLGFFRW
jgi:serine/threonine protein kinase